MDYLPYPSSVSLHLMKMVAELPPLQAVSLLVPPVYVIVTPLSGPSTVKKPLSVS
jgi:hypothetical protein